MRILGAVLGLLLAVPVMAQTPGTVVLHGPSFNPALPQVTPEAIAAAVNAALAAKADVASPVFTGVLDLPTLNITSTAGLQFGGLTGYFVTAGNANQQGVFVGPGAGQWFADHGTNTAFGMVAVGVKAAQNLRAAGSEMVCVGQYSCWQLTGTYGVTALGQSTVAFDPTPSYVTAIGNDAMRDTVGNDGSTAVGAQSQRDGVGSSNTSVGAFSLQGNSGSITVTGTPVAGDVLHVTFATTNPNVTGLPLTVAYTVGAAPTTATVATGLAAAINAQAAVGVILASGNNILTELSGTTNWLTAFIAPVAGSANVVGLHFPGGQATGWAITATIGACTGTCTETLTSNAPFSGIHNLAEGNNALYGVGLTSASFNDARGDFALQSLAGSSSGILAYGSSAGASAISGGTSVLMGLNAGSVASDLTGEVIIGSSAASGLTTGSDNTIIGASNGTGACVTSGIGNIEIGFGACVISPTTNWQLDIQRGAIRGANNNVGGGGGGGGQIGVQIASAGALNATFVVSDYGGAATQGAHIGVVQTTAPAISGCTGCTLNATAADAKGTLTEGTAQTGYVLTFNKAFATVPDCVLSSPTGHAFTSYTATTTTLTVVNASQTGSKFTHVCVQ